MNCFAQHALFSLKYYEDSVYLSNCGRIGPFFEERGSVDDEA
jgi:hypothetical protein